jgi:hypothetical protein
LSYTSINYYHKGKIRKKKKKSYIKIKEKGQDRVFN